LARWLILSAAFCYSVRHPEANRLDSALIEGGAAAEFLFGAARASTYFEVLSKVGQLALEIFHCAALDHVEPALGTEACARDWKP
jgi:hypothetical protein